VIPFFFFFNGGSQRTETYIRRRPPWLALDQRRTRKNRQPDNIAEKRVPGKHHRYLPREHHFPSQGPNSQVVLVAAAFAVGLRRKPQQHLRKVAQNSPVCHSRFRILRKGTKQREHRNLLRGKQDPADGKGEGGEPQAGGGPVSVCSTGPGKGAGDDSCDGDTLWATLAAGFDGSLGWDHGNSVLVPQVTTYRDRNKLQFINFSGPPSSK